MKLTDRIYYYKSSGGPPVAGLSSSNTYIIRGEPRLAITDPGPSIGFRLKSLRREMNTDGLTFQDINKVIITHAHPDHAQSLPLFFYKYHAQVYAHPNEKRILENPELQWTGEFEALGPFAKQATWLTPKSAALLSSIMYGPVKRSSGVIPVREGATLNLGAPAEIIELPGHRPGEIGIHLPEEKALITGDLINHKRYDLPSLNMPLSDIHAAISSLKKIQLLDINTLAPSHDIPVTGKDKIQEWLAAALARCARMLAVAEEEVLREPDIPLAKLGKLLAGNNDGVPLYEIKFLAFVVLKGLELQKPA